MTEYDYENDEFARRRRDQAWNEFRATIRDRLNEIRPGRVDEAEREWREPVYGWARQHMPDETELVRRIARAEVDRQEGEATRRGNDYLRDYWQGRMPLGWDLVGPYPIRVDGVRVRLDVATPNDVARAADQLAAELTKTFQSGLAAVSALRYLGQRAIESGLTTVAKIGDLPAHGKEDEATG